MRYLPRPKAPQHGRYIYAYRNIRTNQVIYSLDRTFKARDLRRQLPDLGANYKPPTVRKDVWKPFWTVVFPENHLDNQQGLDAFFKLREWRTMRELNTTPSPRLHRNYTRDQVEALQEKLDNRGGNKKETVWDIIKREKKKLRIKVIMDQKANSIADLAAVLHEQEREGVKLLHRTALEEEGEPTRAANIKVAEEESTKESNREMAEHESTNEASGKAKATEDAVEKVEKTRYISEERLADANDIVTLADAAPKRLSELEQELTILKPIKERKHGVGGKGTDVNKKKAKLAAKRMEEAHRELSILRCCRQAVENARAIWARRPKEPADTADASTTAESDEATTTAENDEAIVNTYPEATLEDLEQFLPWFSVSKPRVSWSEGDTYISTVEISPKQVYTLEGVQIQWQDTLDPEYAEVWPEAVVHKAMGVVGHIAPEAEAPVLMDATSWMRRSEIEENAARLREADELRLQGREEDAAHLEEDVLYVKRGAEGGYEVMSPEEQSALQGDQTFSAPFQTSSALAKTSTDVDPSADPEAERQARSQQVIEEWQKETQAGLESWIEQQQFSTGMGRPEKRRSRIATSAVPIRISQTSASEQPTAS